MSRHDIPTPDGRAYRAGAVTISGLGHLEVLGDGTGRLVLLLPVSARGRYYDADPDAGVRSARRAIVGEARALMAERGLTGLAVVAWTTSRTRTPPRQADLVVERLGVLASQ